MATPQEKAQTREEGTTPEPLHEVETAGKAVRPVDERRRYIETLLRQIESKKYYPTAARRRGIEGRIHIRFALYGGDDIRDVVIDGESQLLKRVARETLRDTAPFTPPPDGLGLPVMVEYVMAFILDR